MTRYIWPLTAILAVAVLTAGGVLIAREFRPAATVRTVTRIVHAPALAPVTVTRWKTRTITRIRTVTAGSGVPCLEYQGRVWFAGGAGASIEHTTCQVTAVQPFASGIVQVVAADGTSGGEYAPVPGG